MLLVRMRIEVITSLRTKGFAFLSDPDWFTAYRVITWLVDKNGKSVFEVALGRFLLTGSFDGSPLLVLNGQESRVVAQVNIDTPAQFAIFDDSPAPAAGRIIFVSTRPGKCKARRTAALFYAAIDISRYQAELELSRPVRVDTEASGNFHVDIIPVPHLHLGDAPFSHKWFYLLHCDAFQKPRSVQGAQLCSEGVMSFITTLSQSVSHVC